MVDINILEAGGTEVTFQPPWNDPEYVISVPEEQDIGTVITVVRSLGLMTITYETLMYVAATLP